MNGDTLLPTVKRRPLVGSTAQARATKWERHIPHSPLGPPGEKSLRLMRRGLPGPVLCNQITHRWTPFFFLSILPLPPSSPLTPQKTPPRCSALRRVAATRNLRRRQWLAKELTQGRSSHPTSTGLIFQKESSCVGRWLLCDRRRPTRTWQSSPSTHCPVMSSTLEL